MGFFKAYDMRGTFGTDFDLDTVYKVGLALPKVVAKGRWLVGRDCRTTSEAVRDALIRGLTDAGTEVTDIGLCTTPMVYFFTAADDYDGSVMITASHNPPTDNGLKVSKRTALPVGYADGLNEVEREVGQRLKVKGQTKEGSFHCLTSNLEPQPVSRYLAWHRKNSTSTSTYFLHLLSYAIDCSNGMASLLAHELFPGATIINDTLDGTFPCHAPNPLKDDAREQISRLVREKGLDCGIIFDGDADRAMFVDEHGDFVQPDYLIPIVARATVVGGDVLGAPKIIHDVRTSRGAIETLREDGFEPIMVPVGHAFAKPILREQNALCGGELAGHYYFREFFGCDSGVLAATRILGEIAKAKAAGTTFSEMMRPIVSRYANSGELNFRVEDKDAAIERVLAAAKRDLPPERSRSAMDGLRLEYDEGWFNIRKSNTEPYLRLIAEAKTKPLLDAWLKILSAAIQA